ncbi:MAG: dihydroneopterin aldolase [Nitrospirales bacterium]
MEVPIIIEGIQCSVHCGVTEIERRQPQPIVIDLELHCPNAKATHSDDLLDTVDYGEIVQRVTSLTSTSTYNLLEALTEHVKDVLFREFPISHLKAWVRKTSPPLEHINGSVGVRLSQSRPIHTEAPSPTPNSKPSAFLLKHYSKLHSGKILDLATGYGRNALFLAKQGFSVVGIDRDEQALAHLQKSARTFPDGQLVTRVLDLETNTDYPPDFGKEEYDAILISFYLFRPLFPNILQALKPGGLLFYETFLIDNHTLRNHPRNKNFCLEHNELLNLTKGLRILHYQEGEQNDGPQGIDLAFTARLVAQKE